MNSLYLSLKVRSSKGDLVLHYRVFTVRCRTICRPKQKYDTHVCVCSLLSWHQKGNHTASPTRQM